MRIKSHLIGACIAGASLLALAGVMTADTDAERTGAAPAAPSVLPTAGRLLPPPPSFLSEKPLPDTGSGTRRLKIWQPENTTSVTDLKAAENNSVSGAQEVYSQQKDLYLVGTRGADLIREPVTSRVEAYPTVSLEEAVEGALSLEDWGFELVRAFLNQSLGENEQIHLRARALMEKLSEQATSHDITTIADAANLVIEAASRTYWAGYMVPFVFDERFELDDGAKGWDFGADTSEPYARFIRISPNDNLVGGPNMVALEGEPGYSLLTHGINGVNRFDASDVKDGIYRVAVLSAARPDGDSPLYPFGVDFKAYNKPMLMIDTRATDFGIPLISLETEGPKRIGLSDSAALAANHIPYTGTMLLTRIEVQEGHVVLDFRELGADPTYITGIILYPDEQSTPAEELTAYLVQFLETIQTAAGPDRGNPGDILPLVDPAAVFSDAATGLPTADIGNNFDTDSFVDPVFPLIGGPGTFEILDDGGEDNPPLEPPSPPPAGPVALIAEAGVYDPVPLGEDFTLNGCGSSIASEALCNLTDTSSFEITWLLDGEVLGTGLELLLATGEGSPFDSEGDYNLTLQIEFNGELLGDGSFIDLLTGGSLFLPGQVLLTSVDTALLRIVAPVPEPEMLAVLLPGVLYAGYRLRRRKARNNRQHK